MKREKLLLVVFLFILLFWGCKEKEIIEPDPVPTYIVQISSTGPGTINPSGAVKVSEGGSLSLTPSMEDGIESKATLNGTEIPMKNGKYLFSVNSDSKVVVAFEKTAKWQLLKKQWSYVKSVAKNGDGNWEPYLPSSYDGGVYKFLPDDTYKVSFKNGFIGDGKYSVAKDSVVIGGVHHQLQFNGDTLGLKGIVKYYGKEKNMPDIEVIFYYLGIPL